MGTTLRINGAIDRHSPDPSAPSDPQSVWVGMVTVGWSSEGPAERTAAILVVSTGRGTGDPVWGARVLVLRWLGDPPPPEIAQTAYDVIKDGGPSHRSIQIVVNSQPRTEAQPSYRVARAS